MVLVHLSAIHTVLEALLAGIQPLLMAMEIHSFHRIPTTPLSLPGVVFQTLAGEVHLALARSIHLMLTAGIPTTFTVAIFSGTTMFGTTVLITIFRSLTHAVVQEPIIITV